MSDVTLIGLDRDKTQVWQLENGLFIGITGKNAAEALNEESKTNDTIGITPSDYRAIFGPVTNR